MKSFSVRIETYGGVQISNACKDACALAKFADQTLEFTFNGVTCTAKPDSNPKDIAEKWHQDFCKNSKA